MIGLNQDGNPQYYKFPSDRIDSLEPFGNFVKFAVVGIKDKQIQIISAHYSVHHTTKTLPIIPFSDCLQEAVNNPVTCKPQRMYRYFSDSGKWYKFFGWKHVHRWLPGTEWCCKRIHVFYRSIREEPAASRTTYKTPWYED